MKSILDENGKIIEEKSTGVWTILVSRFLRQIHTTKPLSLLGLNITKQHLLQEKDNLYFHYNYNFSDDPYIESEGSLEERLYKVICDSKYNLKFIQILRFERIKKGKKHPHNILPLAHPCVMDEKLYDRIINHKVCPSQQIPAALNIILAKYKDKLIYEIENDTCYTANLWWILPSTVYNPHYFYIKFLEAKLLTKDNSWFIKILNLIPYKHITLLQIEKTPNQSCDVFFRKITPE